MKWIWLLLLIQYPCVAQQTLYVNINNLILRDRPEGKYNVFAILQAPCPLRQEPYTKEYNKKTAAAFYHISLSWRDSSGHHYIAGWVQKKYVATSLSKVTAAGMDKTADADLPKLVTIIPVGQKGAFNAMDFPASRYPGGASQKLVKNNRIYYRGPKGGCYYLAPGGRKRYVDPRLCK